MLRFEKGILEPFIRADAEGAVYFFGPELVPVDAEIELTSDALTATTAQPEPAGICVAVDLAALADSEHASAHIESQGAALLPASGAERGVVAICTCLLPPREKPYSLVLELARRQVMACLNRLEAWDLTDPPLEETEQRTLEAARALFMQAVVAASTQSDSDAPASHESLATAALLLANRVGEYLALTASRRAWRDRVSGATYRQAVERFERAQGEPPPEGAPILLPGIPGVRLAGRPTIGTSVSPGRFSESVGAAAAPALDFLHMPLRWKDLEPTEGDYNFAPTDKWITWAVRSAKIPLAAGPVIDFRPGAVPEWLYIWERDYETLRDLVLEHLKQVITRYRRTIRRWTVVSGLHVNRSFPLSFEQMMDLTRQCVLLTRRLHPQASVVVELAEPWGEYFASNRKSVPPIVYAEMLTQQQIRVDALAVRLQMGQRRPGQTVRDLGVISEMLDRIAEAERPVLVTAAGAPAAESLTQPQTRAADTPPEGLIEGRWDGAWDEQTQARWLRAVATTVLAKPYIHSFCWQELYDAPGDPEMPTGGLFSAAGSPRPALAEMLSLKRAILEGALAQPAAQPATA